MRFGLLASVWLASALSGCDGDDLSKPPVVDGKFPVQKDGPKVAGAAPKRAEPPTTVEDAVRRSVAATRAFDLALAVEMAEQAVKLEPENKSALDALAFATQAYALTLPDGPAKYAMFHRSAELMRKVETRSRSLDADRKSLLNLAIYNEARAYALEKDADKALVALREAVDSGWDDGDHMASDADLKALRDRPEFAKLVEAARESKKDKALAAEKAKEDAAEARKAMVAAEKPRSLAEVGKFQGFPFGFVLPDVDGKSVTLADFRGKVTVVDLWGTWCPPCKKEIPHLVDLSRDYADRGLAIVGINFEQADKDDWPALIRAFIEEYKIPYPCLIGEEEVTRKVPDFRGYPTTLFLDRAGKVRAMRVGYVPIEQLESIVQVLLEEGESKTAAR